MRSNYKTGDGVAIDEKELEKAQKREKAKLAPTKMELFEQELEVEEETAELTDEEKELIDEVDEEDITEISLEPEKEG
ncbi:MAG: hypothetical protein GF383_10250 [Candidatus Lokiarchaeota archaeon]|nr:hypothetical protein [Candidatus Lokiarchaeota archaeon]